MPEAGRQARDDAAKTFNVSPRYVESAKAIRKKEHVFKMNLLRRHLEPLAWGIAYKKLLALRGTKRGKGGDRRSTDKLSVDTAKEIALELGVQPREAERRLKLADEYDDLPKSEQEKVDAAAH